MIARAASSFASWLVRTWNSPPAWVWTADGFAILIALLLPWSTSLTAIFATAWLVTMLLMLDYRAFTQSLARPISAFPIALFLLALVGTLWSSADWDVRLLALSPVAKLLVLPFMFYHFERSPRGMWVLAAFLISCTLLMTMSWLVLFDPALSLKPAEEMERGIFVKNHINQGQEFALCAVALAYPVLMLLRSGKIWQGLVLGAIASSFAINMVFVIVSRTALVTMPVLLAIFAMLHLKRRTNAIILCAALVLAGVTWLVSPQLQATVASFGRDYRVYKEQNQPTSVGSRLEFIDKSMYFISEAPIIGHGTGSIRGLFVRAAFAPERLAGGQIVSNPHNQTLNVAIQWGVAGVTILYALWWSHFTLFRGEGLAASIGLFVVLQNILTSLFNSHLFDFHEGWMYVLGVGVAGGMVLRAGQGDASAAPVKSS